MSEQTTQKNQFTEMEEGVLKFWEENKIFEKSVEKEAPNGSYVFNDGPPFITGLPHYATLLPSIAKDVIPRYWTMKGYRVERVWGWDCHGLPAENKVENELNLKNKKDIEKLGVGKFVDACRAYVDKGTEQWEWYINRIGRWVDMKHAYKTMDLRYMESVMWAFKELHKKELIYEGYRSSLHCPRCATPLSKFEITMDAGSYKDVTDKSVVIKFKLKEVEDTYILAWTTTPWTLPGNLALAVGEKIAYVKIGHKEENSNKILNYYVAKDRAKEIFKDKEFITLEEVQGKKLVGLEYEPLYEIASDELKNSNAKHKIYSSDFVTTEDGTGIVHIAPNFGEDDFELGKKAGLPIVDLMDENGIYLDSVGEWKDFYFKKANKAVFEDLMNKGIIFSSFDITHSYPFCYRCGTALIYKTQKAWYLDIQKIKTGLLKANQEINWVPEYFKEGRFQKNIESAPDWSLSRSRYWGSPIPVWRCETCDAIKVVGSIQEIEDLSGEKIDDLHRPAIDKPEFKCECGGKMKRVVEVLDCWFESGSMPFAQFHYPFEREKEFKDLFPADFIIEYTGQLRGWFYYLHVLSNALFNSVSFKNVIVSGVLAGTDGRKMSKSFGNYPDPRATLEKYGSDALRMYFMSNPIMLGDDTSLNEDDIKDALRKNVMILWNVVKFYELFAKDLKAVDKIPDSKNILDKWILTRLNELRNEITENLEKYNLPMATRPITAFISDLSTWYLRRSRDRFKGDDVTDKNSATDVTGFVLMELSKLMAPFSPFIAEQVWQKITGNNFEDKTKSVHLENWPESYMNQNDQSVITEMKNTRELVELILAARDNLSIKVRQPLSEASITFELADEYKNLVLDECNIQKISYHKKDDLPFGENWKIFGDNLRINTKITHSLKKEGTKREIIRALNALRKKLGFSLGDKISITWNANNDSLIREVFNEFKDDIEKETLTSGILEKEYGEEIDEGEIVVINSKKIILGVKKI